LFISRQWRILLFSSSIRSQLQVFLGKKGKNIHFLGSSTPMKGQKNPVKWPNSSVAKKHKLVHCCHSAVSRKETGAGRGGAALFLR